MSGGGVLGRAALLARLAAEPPLVRDLGDAESQVQPHGIDLRLESVWRFASAGTIGRDSAQSGGGDALAAAEPGAASLPPSASRAEGASRILPERVPLAFDADGMLALAPGPYLVRFQEVVHLPPELMALARPRSSLLRCGAMLHTAVWDAGYVGRSEALLVVANPHGLRLAHGARICQLVFFPLDAPVAGYAGTYQGENV